MVPIVYNQDYLGLIKKRLTLTSIIYPNINQKLEHFKTLFNLLPKSYLKISTTHNDFGEIGKVG